MSDKPYERVSIGVYRHHQKFRAFKIMDGEVLQEYFASQAQAEEWRNRDADRSEKFATRKSARARAQDLPIGLCDVSQKRQRSYGTVIVPTIRAYIRHHKKLVKVISRTYGTSRSREDAVLEVSSLRHIYCLENGIRRWGLLDG